MVDARAGLARILGLLSTVALGACSLSVLDGLSDGLPDAGGGGSSGDDATVPSTDASMGQTSPDVSVADSQGTSKESAPPDGSMTPMESGPIDVADGPAPVDSGSSCAGGCPGNGYCYTTVCAYPSCSDWLQWKLGSSNGVYWIDTDGKAGADPPFRAYCEMIGDGGGWTLVMKMDGNQPTFRHDDPRWTNELTYQVDQPDLDRFEAKLISFSKMPFTKIRMGIADGLTRWLVFDMPAPSMQILMQGGYRQTFLGRNQWKGLVTSPSLQTDCNKEGVNVTAGAAYARIGILSNNDADCNTCDSWIGLGGHAAGDSYSCGNVAFSGGDNGDRNNYFFGYIMVR